MKINENDFKIKNNIIHYYEVVNNKPNLLIIHAQGTSSMSYKNVINKLSKRYHLYLIDCYGHGKSSKNKNIYNLKSIGDDVIAFIKQVIKGNVIVLGHSSGGLIASYIASKCELCTYLILEDAPLFSSDGEERFNTYNYKDLSTVCHNFINQDKETDFVYYYFVNQYCWNLFPEDSREKLKEKLSKFAKDYRRKHPNKNLKVPFWPKTSLEIFNGLNDYDPYFGETFYNNSFNNVNYEELLSNIKCSTLFMKANTEINNDGFIQGALTEEDLEKVKKLIKNIKVEYYDCGHSIHTEKTKEFLNSLTKITNNN